MRNISDTVGRLAAFREMASARAGATPSRAGKNGRLSKLDEFGANPGALVARCHVPEGLPAGAPLVVVLHGCTQNAAGYDQGSGWSTLADQEGFAVLLPEQRRANNANLCFNWFAAEDIGRTGGEAQSIREMIEAMVVRFDLDRSRIHITGLSAGGAMTAVMLATYPELFVGGAIIAGLPYGTAHGVAEAFDRMRGHGCPDGATLETLVRRASSNHQGRWPTLSVWHGTTDGTVALSNMDRIIGQWRGLHGAGETPDSVVPSGGQVLSTWHDAAGRAVLERHEIAGMGHGTPIDPEGDGLGEAMPHMLDVGISSTAQIARGWGIARDSVAPEKRSPRQREAAPDHQFGGVQRIIEDALRTAGLMR